MPKTEIQLDPAPYVRVYHAALAAGIPAREIMPVILRAIRKRTGSPPVQARLWFASHVTDAAAPADS